jgi:hypothetical protein
LTYWRVNHVPVPEIALNPAQHFVFEHRDSFEVGQGATFSVAIENLSDEPMDSVLVKYRVATDGGTLKPLQSTRYRPLPPGDTLHASIDYDPSPFIGDNFLFVEANPEGDHPEQYHPNNLGYVPFRVASDALNPLLDVTFDGVHIRDRDIVSVRPLIKIRLLDNARFRALDDTSLIDLYLRYPNDPISSARGRKISFDGTTCRFVPARTGTNGTARNEAYIEFRPYLSERSLTDDHTYYDLSVTAKDKSGNASGNMDYRVSFEVVYKDAISNLSVYPNPLKSTATFAFLLTGESVPEDFTIEIADMNGRIVRRLGLSDLGAIHIGPNQTREWDGRDKGGAPLPSGIYLYRAVVGKTAGALGHIPTSMDTYFRGGWSRLAIVR